MTDLGPIRPMRLGLWGCLMLLGSALVALAILRMVAETVWRFLG